MKRRTERSGSTTSANGRTTERRTVRRAERRTERRTERIDEDKEKRGTGQSGRVTWPRLVTYLT